MDAIAQLVSQAFDHRDMKAGAAHSFKEGALLRVVGEKV
jgi:hypothetical protein